MKIKFWVFFLGVYTLFIPFQVWGQNSGSPLSSDPLDFQDAPSLSSFPSVYKRMSLDELLNVQVTSVSKRESTVGQSPAAIYVITQDDIHRSGVTTIAESLRMVPGLEVARIDSSTWAISARGFNSGAANKLLVMIDGRSVYSPLFS
ncbi:MAG: TonB-dependent receptor plug domain-containing protein, partial [Verrucomicrobiota bacterium]